MKDIFLLLLLMVLSSCSQTPGSKKQSALSELDLYFEQEIKHLENSPYQLSKQLNQLGQVEEIIIEKPDWKTELVPFTETISSPAAARQSYNRDTLKNGSSTTVIIKSKDASSALTDLWIYSSGNGYDSIVMIKNVANSYYSSTDTLKYFGNGNFSIKAENLPGAGKKIGFLLEGRTSRK